MLGALVEKGLATPQQYPLTINALQSACNQTSNREPVVSYDETTVLAALDELKDHKLVRFVLPSHGRSVVRYRQVLDEALGLDAGQSAILAVLLLRGPQTVGELRIRTERMAKFDSLDEIEHQLEFLGSRQEPLAHNVGRRPGQKEERWATPLVAAADTSADSDASRAPWSRHRRARCPSTSVTTCAQSWPSSGWKWRTCARRYRSCARASEAEQLPASMRLSRAGPRRVTSGNLGDGVGQRGERAIGISTAGFLLGSQELHEVVARGLLAPVVGEQPHPVPGRAGCTRGCERRSNFARLVSPDAGKTEAVVVGTCVKPLECRRPLAPHPGPHGDPAPVPGEEREKATRPAGSYQCPHGVLQGGRYMATP